MTDALILTGIATLTVLATGLGAVPVLMLGQRAEAWRPVLAGLAIGVMGVAAIVGLLIPAVRRGTPLEVGLGVLVGAGGLFWAGRALHHRLGSTERARADRAAWLTFGVLFVHSLPEGLAIGSAYAASGALGAFVIIAVAVQNIPEGTATAIALRQAGQSGRRQMEAAILTSVPQIPGALIAWAAVDAVEGLLPASFAAAGAAMLLLVLTELTPEAVRDGHRGGVAAGALAGALMMVALAVVLTPGT